MIQIVYDERYYVEALPDERVYVDGDCEWRVATFESRADAAALTDARRGLPYAVGNLRGLRRVFVLASAGATIVVVPDPLARLLVDAGRATLASGA